MKKAEFEKIIFKKIVAYGHKPVDFNTTWNPELGWLTTVLTIKNHTVHCYSAWPTEEGTVEIYKHY